MGGQRADGSSDAGSPTSFAVEELRSLELLAGLSIDALTWLSVHGDRITLQVGDHMFETGQPAAFMFLVVSGRVEGYEVVGGQEVLVAITEPGQVTGMLPFSRMTTYPRYTVAREESQVLRVQATDFPEMLAVSPDLGQRLVAQMSDRVRGDVRLEQQREKMVALGRLSAGLAHELNNPVAAIQRTSQGLAQELNDLAALTSALLPAPMSEEDVKAIDDLRRRLATEVDTGSESSLQRSEREDELGEWLEERGVSRPWDAAAALAETSVGVQELDGPLAELPDGIKGAAVAWLACELNIHRIVAEIASSGQRIAELVAAVKTYSYMDRSPEHKPTDVREGLDDTLTLLAHKIKDKNVRVVRTYPSELPKVSANGGELNQVWTNLIDNALDAVDAGGEVTLEVQWDEGHVSVVVTDDGHGIPDDLRARIFEPFFTTKEVGEGLGLGLDIAMRIVRTHSGDLVVQSHGRGTTARVRLPVLVQSRPDPWR